MLTLAEMCIVGQTRLLLGDGDQYVTGNLPLRLRNIEEHFTHNNTLLAGRVEYCMSNGIYLTVCGDSWTNMKASIVCRTLGFSPYGKINSDLYKLGTPEFQVVAISIVLKLFLSCINRCNCG